MRCSSGIVEGDYRADRVTRRRARQPGTRAWWRPQEAEDYEPPACYHCQALARLTCRNCQQLYCPDHAGRPGLCQRCTRSAWLGLLVFAGVMLVMGLLILLGTVLDR